MDDFSTPNIYLAAQESAKARGKNPDKPDPVAIGLDAYRKRIDDYKGEGVALSKELPELVVQAWEYFVETWESFHDFDPDQAQDNPITLANDLWNQSRFDRANEKNEGSKKPDEVVLNVNQF